ncbi:MAG: helix-turn-helix domain-containing protein [Candidatus Aminicenantes bacterium]|nr:helix-turn-helix domain-containing protein [Candidatus Aminicenantes bacterium]NIM78190.1 helix-turn-helix domain-containing protein [Candidatus Aminicenantes bacterium]NIN17527.1 helix-turn-helix domain-containing protein [Candidatus Aminicenantes bacterium]NIN84179.1 helix-turn-helix domain-containing protein [Candidatus Aminicenantes bacterium]NIO80174.1 helix-turn-helix domain-containing protein [Candidatus Aminicenantes bacterium]
MKVESAKTIQNKAMRGIGSRLKKVRLHFGHTQKKMAAYFGMGSNAYGKAENGYNAPGLKIFYILATRFGISLDWLVLGWGSMFYEKKTADDELSREINEMLGLIDKLPLVRHLILGYFQELKLNYHEVIQQELSEKSQDTDKRTLSELDEEEE